ncbi:T9SS type A sorting domain-containing protein [Ekhidna sp.]
MKKWHFIFFLIPYTLIAQQIQFHPGEETICYASNKVENTHVPAKLFSARLIRMTEPTSHISVAYNGFTEEAQAAFQYAVDIWARTITSEVPIRITANWSQLGSGVLGSASATSTVSNFENAPEKDVRYPLALAEKLARKQLNFEAQSEISANFNSQIDWYYGTDANPPSNQFDLVSVVLHEIGHGLGFSASFGANAQLAVWGLDNTGQTNMPIIYDLYLFDQLENQLINESIYPNNSEELLDAVTNNSVAFGSNLARNTYGTFPPIYAPNPWNGGSSISHLDEAVFPAGNENSLMSPQFGLGEAIHLPGEVTQAIFAEMGWVHTFLNHQEILFAESPDEPIRFLLDIESDSSIISENIILIVSGDEFSTTTSYPLNESLLSEITFEVNVPYDDLPAETQYYFEYTSPDGRLYQFPNGGSLNALSVAKSQDLEAPSIAHIPISFITESDVNIQLQASDNFGIDTAYIEYKTSNSNNSQFAGLSMLENIENGFAFSKSQQDLGLSLSDTLFYQIHVQDKSINENTITFPSEGFSFAKVIEIGDPVDYYELSFDTPQASDSLELINLKIDNREGFNSNSIGTEHPYSNDAEGLASFMLKHPINLQESTMLSFEEILLSQPTSDFLLIEGSQDNGASWTQIGEIADASSNASWLERFNSTDNQDGSLAVADPSLYRNREIILIDDNLPFAINDNLLIRFSFIVDGEFNGWGISIDNIRIGEPIVSSVAEESSIALYPNPVFETLNIRMLDERKLRMNIRELSGRTIDQINLAKKQVYSTSKLFPGIYIAEFIDSNGEIIDTKKIIKK